MIINYINWNINPEIFNFFGIRLGYYGVLFVGGLVLCVYILSWIFKKENISRLHLEKLTIYSFIGIFAGARLGHCLFYQPGYYLSNPLEIILPIQRSLEGGYEIVGYQGLASHGGTIGVIIALILYSRKTKESLIRTFDLIAVVAPLAAFFIRIANLMNSEIIGTPTTVPWAFIFERVDQVPRHPSQLYEAIVYLLIFGLTIYLYKNKHAKPGTGFFLGLATTLIFVSRFFIEFIKEKQVPFEENMTLDMGQLLSIPFIIGGIGFVLYGILKKRNSQLQGGKPSL